MSSSNKEKAVALLTRVNMEYADVPNNLEHKGVSVRGDIRTFVEEIARNLQLSV
jgi:hypothetical protein